MPDFTVRDIARKVDISQSTLHFIFKKHLKVRKISARWVSHLLVKEVKVANKLLRFFPKYDKNSLPMSSQVMKLGAITFEPVRKVSNKMWATKHNKRPIISKRSLNDQECFVCNFLR
jgi:hypothetical protein